MSRYFFIIILTSLINTELYAQPERFNVKPAPFSSRIYDEFSPVFYKGGIVFCSNQSTNSLVSYVDEQNKLFKIFFVTKKGISGWNFPKILAKEITTDFNDGPVTFNENGNIMYYSRNSFIKNSMRNISDTSNKLGIYSSSDMPGGSGGIDLYYCNRRNNDWDIPVNLGPVINTAKNESFPFAGKFGKLFLASDGRNGFGGKDLYYTQEINGEWIVPVHLDSAINSTADNFCLVTDSTFENGYFSTNRLKTDDIFIFNSAPVEFTNCDTVKENNYCFTFYDEHHQLIDTVQVIYKWDFSDGIIRLGKEVRHCFPGPGKFSVKLSIFDELTGDTLAFQVNYKVELENIEQAYINSYNIGNVGKPISFEGITRDLKGIMITDYFWDFGDGFKTGGTLMNTTFKKKGEYMVKLGLLAEKDSLRVIPKICVMKKIIIN